MRTGAKHDAPFGEWSPTINGEPVFPEQETVTQSIYSVDGERTVIDAAYVAPQAVGALTITGGTLTINFPSNTASDALVRIA